MAKKLFEVETMRVATRTKRILVEADENDSLQTIHELALAAAPNSVFEGVDDESEYEVLSVLDAETGEVYKNG